MRSDPRDRPGAPDKDAPLREEDVLAEDTRLDDRVQEDADDADDDGDS